VDVSDGRGKNISTSVRTSADSVSKVKSHISNFPRHISHYARHRTSKEYLKGVSGVADMYRLYVDECRLTGDECVSEWVYWRIFNTEFNLIWLFTYLRLIPAKNVTFLQLKEKYQT